VFNHEAYNERLKQIRVVVQLAVDDMPPGVFVTWQKDVGLRYSRFLAERGLEQMQRVVQSMGAYELMEDKQKHRNYCAQELMGIVAGIHAASALMRGAVIPADAIGAEAMMRIYQEVNEPKAPANEQPSDPAVETVGLASEPRN
jgi:hypothetical protein